MPIQFLLLWSVVITATRGGVVAVTCSFESLLIVTVIVSASLFLIRCENTCPSLVLLVPFALFLLIEVLNCARWQRDPFSFESHVVLVVRWAPGVNVLGVLGRVDSHACLLGDSEIVDFHLILLIREDAVFEVPLRSCCFPSYGICCFSELPVLINVFAESIFCLCYTAVTMALRVFGCLVEG